MTEQTINQAQVDEFLAGVPADATTAQLQQVIARIDRMIGGPELKAMNRPTMQAIRAALAARL